MTMHDRARAMNPEECTPFESVASILASRTGWRACVRAALLAVAVLGLGCSASDSGGMSGTGISQGSINSFGSIFVNGVEWNVAGATIELDGVRRNESDLRVGMVVRVDGTYSTDGLSGDADRVTFDDSIEGPIEAAPIETVAGLEKTFSVLGTSVIARSDQTAFDDGATYAGLAANDVVEVSGFVDATGAIHATRIQRKGVFPTVDDVELRGRVANLVKNQDGSGIFDLGTIIVRYESSTTFKDLTRASLATGDLVEVKATILDSDEVDAERIELETVGFGSGDLDDAKVEGIVVLCVESPDYCIDGVPIDDNGATFDPIGYTPMPGDLCEAEGSLVAGVLVATRIRAEDDDHSARNVRIDAAATSVNGTARTLVILGVTISADGNTRLEDKSDLDDDNLAFSELQAGQYLRIEAVSTGTNTARALKIERDDADAGDDDVRLEGPVTALDPNAPSLSILGQSVPLDGGTQYRDENDQSRSEEEFFRNPGDVALDDIVRARDEDAANLSALTESDEVELETVVQN
ncbi:MAG: hypothetical protein IPK00_22505 [Deltaproteobacteria bacterium]|nr:hypothetical protein [Deltaproteobacteria bacterium]